MIQTLCVLFIKITTSKYQTANDPPVETHTLFTPENDVIGGPRQLTNQRVVLSSADTRRTWHRARWSDKIVVGQPMMASTERKRCVARTIIIMARTNHDNRPDTPPLLFTNVRFTIQNHGHIPGQWPRVKRNFWTPFNTARQLTCTINQHHGVKRTFTPWNHTNCPGLLSYYSLHSAKILPKSSTTLWAQQRYRRHGQTLRWSKWTFVILTYLQLNK